MVGIPLLVGYSGRRDPELHSAPWVQYSVLRMKSNCILPTEHYLNVWQLVTSCKQSIFFYINDLL